MKNSLKALILLLFTMISTSIFAQKVDKFNLSSTSTSLVNQFLVLDKDGMSVEDGYKMATEWVNITYNTPKKVIKEDVENEYIRIQGIGNSIRCSKMLGELDCLDIKYSISLEFKDNKLKFQLINLQVQGLPLDPNTPVMRSSWTVYNPQLQDLTKKNGKRYRVRTEDAVSTMSYLNGLADNMRAYLENPLVKEEDW
jgi:hypothetical protein